MAENKLRMHEAFMEEYFIAKCDFVNSVLVSNFHLSDEEIKNFVIKCDTAFHDGLENMIAQSRKISETIDVAITIGSLLDQAEKK